MCYDDDDSSLAISILYNSSDESPDIPVKFHIILIQLLVMLAATDEVMSKKVWK